MTTDGPVLSVLTVAGDPAPPGAALREALQQTYASLAAQTDRRWEWCLAAPEGTDARGAAGLPLDPRVVPVAVAPGVDPAEALARALEAATGGHAVAVRAGDLLAPGMVAAVGRRLPADRWGYTDERQRTRDGGPDAVWRKPDDSPELLRSQPFAVRTALLPTDVLSRLGGLQPGMASAAWYDAVLRVSESAGPAVHIAEPLVVRTDPDPRTRFVPGAPDDHVRAVREHCRRTGIEVDDVTPVALHGIPLGQRLRRSARRSPAVSIVIPTRGSASVVRGRSRTHVVECVRSLVAADDHPGLEVVVVYDDVTPPGVLADLRELLGDRLVLVRYEGWFHFARKCNVGALAARGELLCFLNDDMEVTAPGWLAEMVGLLDAPDVGAVGARLLFEDGSLQHAGHLYTGGDAGHAYFGWEPGTLAQGGTAQLTGERSGVTAACMLVRAADFRRIGGFSMEFPVNYNDVDLCLKLREIGFRILYTPYAQLFHFESQTREPRILPSERDLLARRWSVRMRRDPYVRPQSHEE